MLRAILVFFIFFWIQFLPAALLTKTFGLNAAKLQGEEEQDERQRECVCVSERERDLQNKQNKQQQW